MEERILEFIRWLRDNGLRISTSESLDALAAVRATSLADREVFKSALRSALVKRSADIPPFDDLFEAYFTGLKEALDQAARGVLRQLSYERGIPMADLARVLDEAAPGLSGLTRFLLGTDATALEAALLRIFREDAVRERGRLVEPRARAHDVLERLGLERTGAELRGLEERLQKEGLSQEAIERFRRQVERNLESLRDAIREILERDQERRLGGFQRTPEEEKLWDRSFYTLSERDVAEMKELVRKLAERMKNAAALRLKRERRGRLDAARTFRRNLRYGGVPMELKFRKRAREKPNVVILCDVSDSVRHVARFLLLFVYALQDLFSRVRSFVFVSDLGEVTQLFRDRGVDEAIDLAYKGAIVDVFAHSNYGRALRIFHRDSIEAVGRHTTLIVLGDGRTNYNDPCDWVLEDLRRRAKNVVWLNPESPTLWAFGDSAMNRYAPHCDVAEECANLRQLRGIVEKIVL